MPGMQLTIIRDRYAGHARSPWLVVVPRRFSPTGQRRYRRFATKKSAQAFAASLRQQVQQPGGAEPPAALPRALAADATTAARLLEGTGMSLTEAVRQLLATRGGGAGRGRTYTSTPACPLASACTGAGASPREGAAPTVPAAVPTASAPPSSPPPPTLGSALALLEGARAHQSAATRRTRRCTLRRLFARNPGLADTSLAACTPSMLQSALDAACPHSAQAWNTARRYLHALFAFAIRRHLCQLPNPVSPLELKRVAEGEIAALPPAELRALFAACRPATAAECAAAASLPPRERRLATADTSCLRAYIAICAFAGVRPAECSRLTWADVDWEDGILSVRAANAKTGGTRHIPLHATLRRWLASCRPATAAPGDRIAPAAGLATRLCALRRRAGYGAATPWPRDVLRHSYATYYLKAACGELSQLQYNMGHRDARLLYARYTNMRGVTKAAAQSWWQVGPLRC